MRLLRSVLLRLLRGEADEANEANEANEETKYYPLRSASLASG